MSVSSATGICAGISLREILPDATFLNSDDVKVRSCAGVLGECRNNDLFVAIVHPEHDGHEDAARAIRRGAKAVLGERMLPVSSPQCIVPDSRVAYGRICHALAAEPCDRLHTIGVAGTDGKTTTGHLISSILEVAGKVTGLHSSIHQDAKNRSRSRESQMTPPRWSETMARMVTEGNGFGVIEVNSVDLAQHQFAGMQLDVAVLTNMRGSHFEFHNSLVNYRRAQLRLLDYLKPAGVAVLNADDPGTWFVLDRIEQPTLTVGIKQQADVTAKIVESDLYGSTFMITAGDETAMVRTKIPGMHHVYNCLASAATALLQGIDLGTIARGIERVESLPGRMNLVKCGQKFTVAVDESASPYRLGVALNLLNQNTKGKVYCVFSAPDNSDSQLASQFGRVAERACAVPVITRPSAHGNRVVGDRMDYEPIHQILDGFNRPARARVMPDRIAAIEWALDQARPGDAILIAGRGVQPIASLSDGRWDLTDTEVCQSWLYGDSVPGQRIPVAAAPPAIFKIDDFRQC